MQTSSLPPFGQTFRVTPMEQVRAVAAIVNGGYLLKPYVVSQVLDSDGNIVKSNERTVLRQVISEETSATMCKMMEYVVTDGTAGSAKTPRLPRGRQDRHLGKNRYLR